MSEPATAEDTALGLLSRPGFAKLLAYRIFAMLSYQVVAVTVGLSVLLHGASAAPLAARYGRWYERAAADPEVAPGLRESAATPVTPRRRRLGPLEQPEG